MQSCFLAVDIGASSGRHMLGTVENGRMVLKEMYRFENRLVRKNGHLCWDMSRLAAEVVAGMAACKAAGYTPDTMGIDTWAVDFVLLDAAGVPLGDAVAYRDDRTAGWREKLAEQYGLSFDALYRKTGIQYQPFNTIYQLAALKAEHPEQLAAAAHFLMVPDYLNYLLTGVCANEYTNATTTALVGAESKTWDDELIAALGLPRKLFGEIKTPGTALGRLRPEIQKQVGFDCTVLLPATHDTGSAFLAVPAVDDAAVTLSSGTWSLIGVENAAPITTPASREANFTNEGGYCYRYRYLKNSMGLWMVQSVRRELAQGGTPPSFSQLMADAEAAAGFAGRVDVNDPRFLAPDSMIAAVKVVAAEAGGPAPTTTGEILRCIYSSLANDYKNAVDALCALTGKAYTSINIVGGGSKDMLLNQATANATGLPVYAGPTEGTALGNLMVQFIAAGAYPDLAAARFAIHNSFSIKEVLPQ